MKAVKFLVKAVLWIVAIVVVVVLALPLWIGPVAKGVANAVVPGITGTGFHLGEFGLNPYVGTLHVGDMQLANPKEFSEKNAVELSKFDADLAVTSLFCGKKIRIETVDIDGIVVYSDTTASNFRKIAANVSGDTDADKAEEPEKPVDEAAPEPEKDEEHEEKKGKGIQIDRVTVKNVTVKYGIAPLKVPIDIVIEDIGKESEEGASLDEVLELIYSKILSAAGIVGGKLSDLGKGVAGIAADGFDAAKNALDAGNVDAAKDAIKDVHQGIKSAIKDSAVSDAVKSIDLKKAGDGLKDLFK